MRLNAKEKQVVKEFVGKGVATIKNGKYAIVGYTLLLFGLMELIKTVSQSANLMSLYLPIEANPPSVWQWLLSIGSTVAGALLLARDYIARVAENGNQ